jgi:hypothetical protein
MYAVQGDSDRNESSRIQKCFIITPSLFYINPSFSELASDEPSQLTPVSSPNTRQSFHRAIDPCGNDVPSPSTITASESSLSSFSPFNSQTHLFNPSPLQMGAQPREGSPLSFDQDACHSSATSISNNTSHSELGLLTKKCVRLLMTASPNGSLDLNQAARELGVKRRRLYDVTTVLEGIGMIAKQGKKCYLCNSTCARERIYSDPSSSDSDGVKRPPKLTKTASVSSSPYFEALRDDVDVLLEQELLLDLFLGYMSRQADELRAAGSRSCPESLKDMPKREACEDKSKYLYLTYADFEALPQYAAGTILGVQAPAGTTLAVPDPDQGERPGMKKFEIRLSSKSPTDTQSGITDPINIHLIRPSISSDKKLSQGPIYRNQQIRQQPAHSRMDQCQPKRDQSSSCPSNCEVVGQLSAMSLQSIRSQFPHHKKRTFAETKSFSPSHF